MWATTVTGNSNLSTVAIILIKADVNSFYSSIVTFFKLANWCVLISYCLTSFALMANKSFVPFSYCKLFIGLRHCLEQQQPCRTCETQHKTLSRCDDQCWFHNWWQWPSHLPSYATWRTPDKCICRWNAWWVTATSVLNCFTAPECKCLTLYITPTAASQFQPKHTVEQAMAEKVKLVWWRNIDYLWINLINKFYNVNIRCCLISIFFQQEESMWLDSAIQWFLKARQESGSSCPRVIQMKTLTKLWMHLLKWGRNLMSSRNTWRTLCMIFSREKTLGFHTKPITSNFSDTTYPVALD